MMYNKIDIGVLLSTLPESAICRRSFRLQPCHSGLVGATTIGEKINFPTTFVLANRQISRDQLRVVGTVLEILLVSALVQFEQ